MDVLNPARHACHANIKSGRDLSYSKPFLFLERQGFTEKIQRIYHAFHYNYLVMIYLIVRLSGFYRLGLK